MSSYNTAIANIRNTSSQLLNVLAEVEKYRHQYTWEDLGTALDDSDFTGMDIDKAQLVAAIGSWDAFLALLAAGHGTNLSYMRQ